MSDGLLRRGLFSSLVGAGLAASAAAQQLPGLRGFATPEAAAAALTGAVRGGDETALAAILGDPWRDLVPTDDEDFALERARFLAAWDESHKVAVDGDKATIEVGKSGWTLPIMLVKQGAVWRFDVVAGIDEIAARQIGRNELGAIQTLLAIGDAEAEYAALDPMKTGSPAYATRLASSPGKRDGLYWPTTAGEPDSPLGAQVANSQSDGSAPGEHYGYNFRLLYGQGPAASGGAHSYIVNGRMIGGFAAIAWPVGYGTTGLMTFIMGYKGDVYQRDLGPQTAQRAAMITSFNPETGWEKSNTSLP
ncbi:MAG: DUF2950 domain-containing protein [Rhodospirillales bacterium]|nr:DUF2950 domain-containing protein [Rhodospirillales bacterium]